MKTVNELREILCEQIDGVRHQEISIDVARTVVNQIGKFLHSIKLELEYAKLKGRRANVPALENASMVQEKRVK